MLLDEERILWAPKSGTDDYNLYRGPLGSATFLPIPGDGFLYVVTRTVGGVESSAGLRSDGSERSFHATCP